MPKRIIHGEALWRSDKLARVTPPKYRAEYANLLPLALANGVFEANPARVWAEVYSYNRGEITRNDVEKILQAFDDIGLLFRWSDETGKAWGYWTGSEKPGRLPSQSMRKHYELGPTPPQEQLSEYLKRNCIATATRATAAPPTPSRRKPIKTALPSDFALSDAVRKWAAEQGFGQLDKHLEHFTGLAKARGYTYCDWDAAFKNAIRDNWAKLDRVSVSPSGKSVLERTKAALEGM